MAILLFVSCMNLELGPFSKVSTEQHGFLVIVGTQNKHFVVPNERNRTKPQFCMAPNFWGSGIH